MTQEEHNAIFDTVVQFCMEHDLVHDRMRDFILARNYNESYTIRYDPDSPNKAKIERIT